MQKLKFLNLAWARVLIVLCLVSSQSTLFAEVQKDKLTRYKTINTFSRTKINDLRRHWIDENFERKSKICKMFLCKTGGENSQSFVGEIGQFDIMIRKPNNMADRLVFDKRYESSVWDTIDKKGQPDGRIEVQKLSEIERLNTTKAGLPENFKLPEGYNVYRVKIYGQKDNLLIQSSTVVVSDSTGEIIYEHGSGLYKFVTTKLNDSEKK